MAVVQDVQLMSEVDNKPKRVSLLINDSMTRWCSTYAMLVCFYKLQTSIQCYNEKAVQDKDLAAKVPTWEITTADYPKMESILMIIQKIKAM